MDLRRFITLKTVVEEGSFLRASQKLCCTQSTVTFHIQQLEQEFSVQLFEKIGRRMCLTREGKKLLPHIYELTRVMDTLREAAKKESDPDGELRVVSGETLLSYRMPQVLQRFRQRAPKVRLSLQSLNCYVIRDALLNDEADVGVFYRVGNDDALNRRELGEQSLVLVASPQIADVDFTEPGRHNACSKRCVAANIGVSYLPRFAVEKELESGELIELPFGEQSQTITAMCAHHAGKAVSPAMHTFIQCVEESFVAG
ncbi:TPA: LysR family transcriptional regulator [Escherichia coli]